MISQNIAPGQNRRWLLPLLILAFCFSCSVHLAADQNYTTLKKFLTAKMYGEAYNELLRIELLSDNFDPKLEKLRKDLLERTRERLSRQARINPDDAAIFTILADIAFHQGQLDKAVEHITKAINNRAGVMAKYVLAKILFRKGDFATAFDHMGTVLEEMPDSSVVFDDFQFLYACKSYGLATAKKISKNSNFVRRATPVSGADNLPEIPDSPFENDPTRVAVAPVIEPDPVETTEDPTSINDAQPTDADEPDPLDEVPLPDETDFSDEDDEMDQQDDNVSPRPVPIDVTDRPVPVKPADEAIDPEKENIKKAEYWMDQAKRQFTNKNYTEAEVNLNKATELYEGIEGKEDLRKNIGDRFAMIKRYRDAVKLFEEENYKQALRGLEEGYNAEPERFREAPLMLGKIFLIRENPDYDKALYYFDIVTKDKDLEPQVKRDIEWTKMEIFFDTEKYEEANEVFQDFLAREEAFSKNQVNFNQLRYGLWYQLNKLYIHIGLGIFALMFLVVFILKLLPAISFSFADAITSARRAMESHKFDKAVKLAEKALQKKQPVQVERELFEITCKAHFELKNYVRCKENARILLEKFPDNRVAWSFLAKSSMASHDESDEAIAMYETIYRENPEKTEYLSILAKHYAKTSNYTVEAMNILYTYYQAGHKETPIVKALAEGHVQTRAMGEDVIEILEEVLRIEDKIEYRELLARNYAKAGRHSDSARECIKVLNENINNMGIHVVYTQSMKKLKMLEEAVHQYKEFLNRYPGNEQLLEIVAGLKKDASDLSALDSDDMPDIPDELPMPDLPEADLSPAQLSPEDIDIESFVEPPPEGFEFDEPSAVPVPDFLKDNDTFKASPKEKKKSPLPLPTLDPFDDSDSFLDEVSGDLPEELGGPTSDDLQQEVNSFAGLNSVSSDELLTGIGSPGDISPPPMSTNSNNSSKQALGSAQQKAKSGDWQGVIDILSPVFASERERETGLLLADAWLNKSQPQMAMEIIETLEFDPEIMSERIKDILYRTGLALEKTKKTAEALRMYDMICNVDINFRDAFERSDKLYSSKP